MRSALLLAALFIREGVVLFIRREDMRLRPTATAAGTDGVDGDAGPSHGADSAASMSLPGEESPRQSA